jgi:hypothetical protein
MGAVIAASGELANVYYPQMVERGSDQLKACCVVAVRLADRASAV